MKKNSWKIAFLILLTINLIIVIGLSILIFLPSDKTNHSGITEDQTKAATLDVTTNKSDLTKLINHYIKKEGLNGRIHYEINLTDEVELYGSLPVFNEDINMNLTFEPEALENGDLVLRQKSISIGQLPLPVSYVMKFIQQQYKLPEWVEINPEKETIYVYLTKMKTESGLKVKMKQFNLPNDQIQFSIIHPTE
ncbi:YpmS family protein [Niallia sp. 01092]|uniref:YpmS family protein n=1 Tax=unclassified Niallia TaxID=2837522 RepID=UPI003FD394F0